MQTFHFSRFTFPFLFYIATLGWLSVGVPFVFPSPDEHANFLFAGTFMATGDFGIPDAMNGPLAGIMHPRSVVVVGAVAQPGSFIGWPLLAGAFGKVAGMHGIVWLTPFLVAACLLMWRGLARALTNDARTATIAAALLALHPAFWYYAARGMMHNVPFLIALIAAAWVAFARPFSAALKTPSAQIVEFALAGLCGGAAIFLRTSEAPWVLALAVLFVFFWRRHVRRAAAVVALAAGIALPLAVMGAWNAHLYGSPFVNGYTVEDVAREDAAGSFEGSLNTSEGEAASFFDELGGMLLPFGVHPRAVLDNVWRYGIALFPWMTVLAAAGIIVSLRGKRKEGRGKSIDPWRVLAWTTLGLSVWLGLVYGSWSFNDNPDPNAVTIGDSHVRYWLPVFALSTLFAARAVVEWPALSEAEGLRGRVIESSPSAGPSIPAAIVTAIAILSAILVFGGPDGLVRTRQVLFESAEKRAGIVAATEEDAIVVVDRADKFLFPYRRVIQPLRREETYAALPEAASLAPLYYFGIPFPESDLTYLNTVKLAGLGLRIDPVVLLGDEMLYRITPAAE